MKAALYARVSTDKQKDENTIDTQLNEIRNAIEKDGNSLSEDNVYFDEGWSGAYLARPSLDNLRQDAKQNKFEIVYVYDKGRLSRKYFHQELVIDELLQLSITVKSLHDINGGSPEENVMGGVMGLFHEYERVKTAERFRLAKLNKVSNGNLLGYNPPYGYDYIPVQGKGLNKVNGRFEINPAEAEVIKKIFNWVGVEGISMREVIRRLYDKKISPKKNMRKGWTKGPIIRLLKNTTYIGDHYYNKSKSCIPKNPIKDKVYFKHTNKTSRKARDESEWIKVEVPAIVDVNIFEAVQKQLALNAKYASRNTKHEYLFKGLTYCSCGQKRCGDTARGHSYYRCTDRSHRFPESRQCKEGGIRVDMMDKAVWNKLANMLTDPKLIKQQFKRYLAKQQIVEIPEDNSNGLKKQILELKAEEKRYVSAYGRGTMSEAIFDEYSSDVRKRLETASNTLEYAKKREPSKLIDVDPSVIVKQFTNLLTDLDYNDKVFTVRKIVDKVIATKESITICGNIPLSTSMAREQAGLHAEYWYRRPTECRQINFIQRPDK